MKAVRGKWMLASLFLGLAMTASAENHNGSPSGTARRAAPGETPQRVFSNALNACGLSQGVVGSSFTAAPPPPPPPPVFPEGGGDEAPTLTEENQKASTAAAETKPAAKPEASASTEAPKTESKTASSAGTPPAKEAPVSQSDALAIMSKVNCKTCHGDGRKASDYSAQELAQTFTTVGKMRNKLSSGEVDQLKVWLKTQGRS